MRRRTRIDILRGIVLVGLASAAGVFLSAPAPADDPLGNPLENSKIYQRNMEMVGGKANVVAGQITDGFQSLWHGRTLAITLAVLTLLLAFGFWFVTGGEDRPGDPGS